MLDFIATYRLNEYSDVLGLLITILGFGLTLVALLKSKKIAHAALEAANKVREDLRKVETVAEFSSAVAAMDEIKRLHRKKELDQLPERYSQLRRSLITLKQSNSLLTQEEQTTLQGAITLFAGFERKIEKELANGDSGKVNFANLNVLVSQSIDEIHAVVVRLKAAVGDPS